jgi:hypothetical protein
MRTLADALNKLHERGALSEDGQAEVRIAPMQLPDGSTSAAVTVSAFGRSVLMPSATHFTAKDMSGALLRREISALAAAVSDADGNVQLADGSSVRAVELERVRLTYKLTLEQENILRCVIKVLNAEDRCYRPIDVDFPNLVVLDYAKVAELGAKKLPSLKTIERDVLKKMPGVTRQTLANVLALAGLRRPRSGPRARPKSRK